MNQAMVDQIVQAVLYEGYILYPYQPSSVKNQQRWTFGGIYPQAYSETQNGSDACSMQAQFLVDGEEASKISLTVRFLHLTARVVEKAGAGDDPGNPTFSAVRSLDVCGRTYHDWQEAVERKVELGAMALGALLAAGHREHFCFEPLQSSEPLMDDSGRVAGRLVRSQQRIEGIVEFSARLVSPGVYQVTAKINNATACRGDCTRDEALLRSLASTHMVLGLGGGGFISPTDPPGSVQPFAGACENIGCWPVLVGEPGSHDTLLVSPIILYDYPQVAPQSPGDLFDGCEIDEILTLRIMTMTDDEKKQATAVDPRAAEMMARTQSLAREQLMNLHGTVRGLQPASSEVRHG